MPIRITGMNSGLDTEALVSELVAAYRKKTEKYVKAQTKLTWKQDAWKTMSAKTYSFRSSLDSMRLSSAYKLKTTSVSNSTKATVTASNNAVNGSQSLNITSLAKAGYLTGGKLKQTNGKAVAGNTTLAALGVDAGKSGKISLNGKEITLSSDMTVNDVVSKLNSAGVSASFDETNQRIFVNAKTSGKDGDFTLAAMNEDGREALKQLGLYAKSSSTTAMYEQYKAVDDEYNAYVAGGGTQTRTQWLEQKVQDYIKYSDQISKGTQAEKYLQAAANYKTALDKLASVKNEITGGTRISWDDTEKLLNDSGKFVASDGTIYSLSVDADGNVNRDANGRTYYTADNDPNGTKYYFAMEERSVQATDEDGNPVFDANNDPVMEKKMFAVFRTETELEAGTGGFDVSTADEYLKAQGVTDEQISGYRDAKTAIAMFDDAVKLEEDTYNNRLAALEKEFLDGLPAGATPEDEAAAKANAKEQADAELRAPGAYKEWRSLADLKTAIDNGTMSAQDIENAQKKVTDERAEGQEFVEDHTLFASYAKQYEAAGNDTSTVTQQAVIEEMEKDLQFAMDALAAESTRASDYSEGAVRIDGQDATIYLNGAQYTSSSNTFTINGLTITALATTTTEDKIGTPEADASAITITTATDNQGIYDKIKDFLGEYNNLINAMTGAYNADSAKEYEPLTDDERASMTESQIEKWEERGKSGVLRRDGTLSALMSTLTSVMSKSYEINGKKYSLSTFGIKTLGILNAEKNEQNAYHIDGDADDESVSGNSDKLMAAIVSDPDSVAEFFQLLTHDLSMELGKKMTSTTMRTYGTFYNDKEMAKEYSDYTTTIAKWENKLADIEESYYKKFAAMEKALAALQSQSSQLAGLLG